MDYTKSRSFGEFLAVRYRDDHFDVVVDAIGIQDIWENCASFLKPSGAFVTVGIANSKYTWTSMLESLWLMMIKNPYTPVMFGGVPRRLERVTAFVNEESMKELGEYVHSGRLKPVTGKVYDMSDVQEAYRVLLNKEARKSVNVQGKILVRINGD